MGLEMWAYITYLRNKCLENFDGSTSDHITVWHTGSFFSIKFLTRSVSDHITVSQTGFFNIFFQTHFQPETSVTIPHPHIPGKKKKGLWDRGVVMDVQV